MKMVVENYIGMEKQTFLLSAKRERGGENVQVTLTGKDRHPAHNSAGDEMRRFQFRDFIATTHSFNKVSKRSFER